MEYSLIKQFREYHALLIRTQKPLVCYLFVIYVCLYIYASHNYFQVINPTIICLNGQPLNIVLQTKYRRELYAESDNCVEYSFLLFVFCFTLKLISLQAGG